MSLFSRADNSTLAAWWWTVDRAMLGAIFVLMGFGIMLISTASPPVAEHLGLGSYHFFWRHIVLLGPSVAVMLAVSMLSERYIWRLGVVLFAGCVVALIAVLLTGSEIKGAQRWIHVGGFSLQPSEFVKPAFAILAAKFMSLQMQQQSDTGVNFPGHAISAGLYGLTLLLLLLQPDLGMSVIVTSIWAAQIFLAGFPFRLLIALGVLGVGGLFGAYHGLHHVKSRIDRFLDPESGDNYQVEKSLEAFQNGGLFGVGPGQGTVKLGLPDAHADFIFAVAGEEMGLIFTMILMALYFFVVFRGFYRLKGSENLFAVLAAGGLLTMFGLQALVHMGSSLNVLPAKGMTLPFISYGGSSILAVCLSAGIILALTRRQKKSGLSRGSVSSISAGRK
ncbi:MAG: putative lipid II flippase FtsW [Alphaproteobacteria bacterium]|nr:putative lipid II flippase FtsW [Alphaproteobacteria bacterium]MCD8569986.1 putative lipid II flippase FtsW [Alphaproteobacteria bacterium]